jgi:hypothetical protein
MPRPYSVAIGPDRSLAFAVRKHRTTSDSEWPRWRDLSVEKSLDTARKSACATHSGEVGPAILSPVSGYSPAIPNNRKLVTN